MDDDEVQFGRPFVLARDVDHTGASGTGVVADGVLWPDDTVSIRWRGERPSIVFWQSLDDAKAVHGHNGSTRFVWERMGVPESEYGSAWTELRGYVDQAHRTGTPIHAGDLLNYMDELKRLALSPIREWMSRIGADTDSGEDR